MKRPEINKSSLFVRVADGRVEHVEFTRFDDGSAYCVGDSMERIAEEDPTAWQGLLESLRENGFTEVDEAKAAGIIPGDWSPQP